MDGEAGGVRAAMAYLFYLTGDIVPYVRTTHRQKFADPRAQNYYASQQDIRRQAKEQMAMRGYTMLPNIPLRMGVVINTSHALHKRDLSNILKAIEDGLQHAVYNNDAWIDEIWCRRVRTPNDLTVVIIEELPDTDWSTRWADEFIQKTTQTGGK